MSSGRSRLVFLLLLVAVVVSIITLADGWRQIIIEPVALLLWLGWRVIMSVPQIVYWALVVLLALFPLFRLTELRGRGDFRLAYREEPPPPGRVDFWRETIRQASLGSQERSLLEQSLESLIVESRQPGKGAGQFQVQEDSDLIISRQRRGSGQSKDLDRIQAHIGGLVLPITPPLPLKSLIERLFQPNYTDINEFLRMAEMEKDIKYGSEEEATDEDR